MDMRGLSHFIRDIRLTTGNKRLEEERVEEELAKIKAKFINDSHMTLYDRKKYVCKLMFIAMLGYPVTFGHLEGLKLMAEETSSEKLIGYLSIAVLLNENSPMMALSTHTIYRDLLSGVDFNRGLALTAIANAGNRSFVEVMHNGVQDIVLNNANSSLEVLKRAILTLLCVYRKYPEIVDLRLTLEKLSEYMESSNESLVMACISFMQGSINIENAHMFSFILPKLHRLLVQIIFEKKTEPGNIYYGVPSPWMQAKTLRLLQFLERPQDNAELIGISDVLKKILRGTEKVLAEAQTQQKQRGTTNRVNAMVSVLFEVVSLVIRWQLDVPLVKECMNVVGRFITTKRGANIRYIGLSLLSRLSLVPNNSEFDYSLLCKQYEQHIVVALHDTDVSLRLMALSVLVSMCNEGNANEIVKELLTYLPIGNDPLFRSNLLLSIAHLAEKYFERNSSQYIDAMMSAVADAGELCPQPVVQRVIHTVVNHSELQKRAVSMAFKSLKGKGYKNEALLMVAAFFLGEFGCQIALNPESAPAEQVSVLRNPLTFSSEGTQGVILHALLKLYNVYNNTDVREKIVKIFRSFSSSGSLPLQQWSSECLLAISKCKPSLLNALLEVMPPFLAAEERDREAIALIERSGGLWKNKLTGAASTRLSRTSVERERRSSAGGTGRKHKVLPLKTLYETTSSITAKDFQGEEDEEPFAEAFKIPLPPADPFDLYPAVSTTQQARRTISEAVKTLISPPSASLLYEKFLRHEDALLYQNEEVSLFCHPTFSFADARLTVEVVERQRDANAGTRRVERPEVAIAGVDAGLMLEMRLCPDTALFSPSHDNRLLQVELAARSAYPYRMPPTLRLAVTVDGTEKVYTVALPLLTTHFIVPHEWSDEAVQNFCSRICGKGTPVKSTLSCASADVLASRVASACLGAGGQQADSNRSTTNCDSMTMSLMSLLSQLGYTTRCIKGGLSTGMEADGTSGNEESIIAVGAHATSLPSSRLHCSPVVCELRRGSAMSSDLSVFIYAANTLLQETVLASLELALT